MPTTREIAVPDAGAEPPPGQRGRRSGDSLAPVHLSEAEAEAIVVGLALASQQGLVIPVTAQTATAKIAAAGSPAFRKHLARAAMNAAEPRPVSGRAELIGTISDAIRDERELRIRYSDEVAEDTVRTIKPLALAHSRKGESVAAWCKLRGDFRHFRLDRILGLVALESFFKGERDALLDRYLDD